MRGGYSLILFLHFTSIYSQTPTAPDHRNLYDASYGYDVALKVHTYATIEDPVGITMGVYNFIKGLFVSSFKTHSIYFLTLQHGGHTREMSPDVITGSGMYNLDIDGSFAEASFAEPSRLAFDDVCNLLFVVCKKNRVVRTLNLTSGTVRTIAYAGSSSDSGSGSSSSSSSGEKLTFNRHDDYYRDIPGFDIQSVAGDALYISSVANLHKVVVPYGRYFCHDISNWAEMYTYHSLTYYFRSHDYPSNARIYSVLADSSRGVLFVAVSVGKNVILRVPMSAINTNHYTLINKIVGNEGHSWDGISTNQIPPAAVNGYSSDDRVSLAFPMHLQMDRRVGALFWTESYPYVGEFMLGSLTVRRIILDTGLVDFYAGYNFCQDNDTYFSVGTEGGYMNDETRLARFRYPVSMVYYSDDVRETIGTGGLYVVDKTNNAIRRVAVVINTAAPTAVSYPTSKPTPRPSSVPSISVQPTITHRPTPSPSLNPTLSLTPTFNPTRRPTRRPTVKPTTASPTSENVWVQDNSIFNSIGLGTVHVGAGMYVMSVVVGIAISVFIVIAYTNRHVNPHRQLRTTEDNQDYDYVTEIWGRKVRYAGAYMVYMMGVCIPGSAFYTTKDEDNCSLDQDYDRTSDDRSSETGMSRLLNILQLPFTSSFNSGSSVQSDTRHADTSETDSTPAPSIHNLLQTIRENTSSDIRRNSPLEASSSFTQMSMSPREYRELNPREVDSTHERSQLDLDDSSRSTAPMLVRTFGTSHDGL